MDMDCFESLIVTESELRRSCVRQDCRVTCTSRKSVMAADEYLIEVQNARIWMGGRGGRALEVEGRCRALHSDDRTRGGATMNDDIPSPSY